MTKVDEADKIKHSQYFVYPLDVQHAEKEKFNTRRNKN